MGSAKCETMDSVTEVTIITMKNGDKTIDVVAESVQVCTRENCNCVGRWGREYYDESVDEAVRNGFVKVGERVEVY